MSENASNDNSKDHHSDRWQKRVRKAIGDDVFESKLVTKSLDGSMFNALFVRGDTDFATGQKKVPGWAVRQTYLMADADDANTALKEDRLIGAAECHLQLNLSGITGRDGIVIEDDDDIKLLFEGLYFPEMLVSIDAGPQFILGANKLISHYILSGVAQSDIRVRLNADPLKAWFLSPIGDYDFDRGLGELGGLTKVVVEESPLSKSVCVDTTAYHLHGSTESQEVAFALASGLLYLKVMEQMGLDLSVAANQITFRMAVDTEIFQSMAKFRAFRMLWRQILLKCGVKNAEIEIHAQAAERTYMRCDHETNLLRMTSAAYAGALGGADSIGLFSHNFALSYDDDSVRRYATTMQHILAEESHFDKVGDAAAGSFAIEGLTEKIAVKAWELFSRIEENGGMGVVLLAGIVGQSLEEARQARKAKMQEEGSQIIGVNAFRQKPMEPPSEIFEPRMASSLRVAAEFDLFDGEASNE